MQKLLTKAILKTLPALRSQENVADPIVRFKLFNPCGSATWYITEGELQDDGDYLLFGLCDLFNDGGELGYVSLNELAGIRLQFGLRIERDIYFTPTPLSKIRGILP